MKKFLKAVCLIFALTLCVGVCTVDTEAAGKVKLSATKKTIGDEVKYYAVCPLSSTGEVSSITYIDFTLTKSLTKL